MAPIRLSEDVVPLSDLKTKPGRIVGQIEKSKRPVLLTNRGRGVAVVQSLTEYESDAEEKKFMRAVVQGLLELEGGNELDLDAVKKRLGFE